MNPFQLVIKQMRQRALSTWLTLLSVLLGVGLAVAILILRREGAAIFGQTDYGYDVLIGAKGSPLQLVLNTVYHLDKSPGNIPYTLYQQMVQNPTYRSYVRIAVPFAVGDSYQGLPIMGTSTRLFGLDDDGKPIDDEHVLEYRPGKRYEIAEGKVFAADKFEATLGSDVAALTHLKIGDIFQATHGMPAPGVKPDIHKPKWKVVGILKPTHTAGDRVLYIPLLSFYTIAEHDVGLVAQDAARKGQDVQAAVKEFEQTKKGEPEEEEHDHYKITPDGRIDLDLPKTVWGLSGIMVKARGGFGVQTLQYIINNGQQAAAVNPATEMRNFFAIFLKPSTLLLLVITILVTVVAAVGILVSIYNSVSARLREIAILRALGATRTKVLGLICLEAGLIGLFGGIAGLILGHLLGWGVSAGMEAYLGEGISWYVVSGIEWVYLAAVVLLAALAGLVPAMKAYKTSVAANLVAG
ncbi:MAG TPA: ABC transporter permease [Tepidisphaeraceae bacterium]|jgi:putative ABC transport system permease protein|nr:ABC transporter permease [Tepidisphaeraceae bacterium]